MDQNPQPAGSGSKPGAAGTLIARISAEDIVLYANRSLADYLRAPKDQLLGTPLEVLAGRCSGEISSCFSRPDAGRRSNRLVTDAEGRVFEAKTYSEGGVLDIILDEVTTARDIGGALEGSTGTPLDSLNEDELRTTRQPQSRCVTIGFALLRAINGLAGKLPPAEVRMMVDSFLEETADATLMAGCTVGGTTAESLLSIFGAPRHFADHPLRAVQAACEVMRRAASLHASFSMQGKEIPPSSIGLWTGEALVGTFGSGIERHYTALGSAVQLAERLCRLARPGEILLPDHTLAHLLRVLPDDWTYVQAESDAEPDLSSFQWSGEDVAPVPEHLRRVVYLVGPGVAEDPAHAEYYFDHLWALRIEGHDEPVPILRVVRPSAVADSLELSNDNVLSATPSETLGKYRLLEVVGTGGMGRVWRATDRFGNNVAIKVLHSSEAISDAQIKRFRREAEIMTRLPHRNICRVFEMNEFEGIHYIAMEYVDGLSLADVLYGGDSSSDGKSEAVDLATLVRSLRDQKRALSAPAIPVQEEPDELTPAGGPSIRSKETRVLSVQQTLAIMLRVCEAIQFAHEHGVLHRDIKPGNILLREDGEPLVADFGLAKISGMEGTQSLSISGHVVGTLENMPPEQAESSKDVDERADVYALGTVLFQMLTGRRHFEATGNIVADAQALKTHEPPRLRAFNPRLDADLEIITLKALRNDPAQRYPSVAALRADIDRYRRGEVITAKPVSALDLIRKLLLRNRTATAIAAASLVLIAGTVILSVWSLSLQLGREQAARLEAEESRADAERHKRFAEKQRLEAEDKEQQATKLRLHAESLLKEKEQALDDKNQALDVAAKARERSQQAIAETESERERREAAEQLAAQKDTELASSREQLANLEANSASAEPVAPDPPHHRPPDPAQQAAARRALGEAYTIFNFELSPFRLKQLEKDPDRVVALLGRAIEEASAALAADPRFVPGWMLKGRLHAAAMEFTTAAASFARVLESGRTENHEVDPAMAQEFAEKWADPKRGRMSDSANDLLSIDPAAGAILQLLASKPGLVKLFASGSSPLGRVPGRNETVLALMTANNLTQVPSMTGGGDTPITITIEGEAMDLSPLRGMAAASLSVRGAKIIDWETISQLPLERLDLSGCLIDSLPDSARAFPRLRELLLRDTPILSIAALRQVPQLDLLDLAGSGVSDLTPLSYSRRLRTLDISGSDRTGLPILINLPLDTLTLSPLLITDKAALNRLRGHRTLRSLRTPTDPNAHAPALFWKKLEEGGYDVSSERME